jgi:hypothetical protein
VIRYRYAPKDPPAPFVNITLRNPVTGAEQTGVPAQIDTGADVTVLPEAVVRKLALPGSGELTVNGLGGTYHQVTVYTVQLSVHGSLPEQLVEAIAGVDERWVLLGRDILNAHRILLDGPAQALEILPPAAG